MADLSQSDNEAILRLVGGIILTSQDAERYLKFVLPFLSSSDPNLSAALAKMEKLQKRMLGQLVGDFVDSTTSDSLDFAQHMARLVASRNQVVHHFNETYGAQLEVGAAADVISSLRTLQGNLTIFQSTTEQVALVLLEGLRDITFVNTPEYEQMAKLCASFRQRVAS